MSLLQMSFCGTVMILAVLAIRALASQRLPKRTFVLLWAVVFLRLLLPVEIPSGLSVYSLIGYDLGYEFAGSRNPGGDASDTAGVRQRFFWQEQEVSVRIEGQDETALDAGKQDGQAALPGEAKDGREAALSGEAKDGREAALSGGTKGDWEAALSGGTKGDREAALSGETEDGRETALADGWIAGWKRVLSGISEALFYLAAMTGKSMGSFVWGVGAFVCAVFFSVSYVRCRNEFAMSLPSEDAFAGAWLDERCRSGKSRLMRLFIRRIDVRVSDRIDTPLTYGILYPVILLPKKKGWGDERQLEYILWHEYMHICHWDAVLKLAAVAALCIHWFNPFAWFSYFLLNRDIELACDESVVKKSGTDGKMEYANMLIGMEARRSGVWPLCNDFCRNVIEKRIRSVMKIRRFSAGAVAFSAALVMGVTLVFATSAADFPAESAGTFSFDADYTEEEYGMLRALQFEGYEELSVLEYRNRVLTAAGTEEYWELLERVYQDQALYAHRDDDEASAFVCYVLKPLTAMSWRKNAFSGSMVKEEAAGAQKEPGISYYITLEILNENDLTVGEYAAAGRGAVNGLRETFADGCANNSGDEAYLRKEMQSAAGALSSKWSGYKLQTEVQADYHQNGFEPGMEQEADTLAFRVEKTHYPSNYGMPEESSAPAASEEDYRAVFSLMEPDYKQKSLEQFNRELESWKVKNQEAYSRIMRDCLAGAFAVELSEEEKVFLTRTIALSEIENGEWGQRDGSMFMLGSSKFSPDEKLNGCGGELQLSLVKSPKGKWPGIIWADSHMYLFYAVWNGEEVTVGERDICVGGMIDAVQAYWDSMEMEEILGMKSCDIGAKIHSLEREYSNADINITTMSGWKQAGWY